MPTIDHKDNAVALQINQSGTGQVVQATALNVASTNPVIEALNSGTGAGIFIDQNSNATALSIDSEATSVPLVTLAPLNVNTRGDIAFGTTRIADPTAPSEGDMWYNSTDNTIKIYNGTSTIDLGTSAGGNTLDAAYDQGGAGAGRTITVDTGAVTMDAASGNIALDLQQTNGGSADVLNIKNAGQGAGVNIVQEGNSPAIDILVPSTGISASVALRVTQGIANSAVRIENTSTSVFAGGLDVITNGGNAGNPSVSITQNANAPGISIDCNGNPGSVLTINLVGTASGKFIDTNAGAGTPAHLTNAGVWTDASCYREYKENFEDVDVNEFLQRVIEMPIQRYNPKNNPEFKTLGPFQDELVEWFGLSSEGVRPHEIAAIALVAIKGQQQQIEELKVRITELES